MGKILHGQNFEGARTPEYTAWSHMMQRCYNPQDKKFKDYGGRGIVVCDRWQEAANFLEDIGKKPSVRHTLGRIKNGGNYEPGNCRWETPKQQARNRRSNKLTMANAREIRMLRQRGYVLRELAEEFGVSIALISEIVNNTVWSEKPKKEE